MDASIIPLAIATEAYLAQERGPLLQLTNASTEALEEALEGGEGIARMRAVRRMSSVPLLLRKLHECRQQLLNGQIILAQAMEAHALASEKLQQARAKVRQDIEEHEGVKTLERECNRLEQILKDHRIATEEARAQVNQLKEDMAIQSGWKRFLASLSPEKREEQERLQKQMDSQAKDTWARAEAAHRDLERALEMAKEQLPLMRAALELAHPQLRNAQQAMVDAAEEVRAHEHAFKDLVRQANKHEAKIALVLLQQWQQPGFTRALENLRALYTPRAVLEGFTLRPEAGWPALGEAVAVQEGHVLPLAQILADPLQRLPDAVRLELWDVMLRQRLFMDTLTQQGIAELPRPTA